MKVAALWSGGKDSCLASYEAMLQGYELTNLISFDYKDDGGERQNVVSNILSLIYKHVGRRSPSVVGNLLSFIYKDLSRMIPHDVAPEIVAMQAKAMGIPIIQKEVTWDTFEHNLKLTINSLKRAGVEGAVFGIVPPHFPLRNSEKLREYSTLIAHKDWLNRVFDESGIKPIMPLWEKSPEQILSDLVKKGFEVIIVVIDSSLLDEKWLGHRVDQDFIREVRRLNREKGVHIAGSGYHTLVIDGPIFKKRLKLIQSRKVHKNGYFVLDIQKVELAEKANN